KVVNISSGAGHDTTPITPVPPASFLETLAAKPVPLDTWVELTFCDAKGTEIGSVRRTLKRSARGKVEIDCSDLSFLGMDPMALRVATVMPGLIPYIQLGKGSELGAAI